MNVDFDVRRQQCNNEVVRWQSRSSFPGSDSLCTDKVEVMGEDLCNKLKRGIAHDRVWKRKMQGNVGKQVQPRESGLFLRLPCLAREPFAGSFVSPATCTSA